MGVASARPAASDVPGDDQDPVDPDDDTDDTVVDDGDVARLAVGDIRWLRPELRRLPRRRLPICTVSDSAGSTATSPEPSRERRAHEATCTDSFPEPPSNAVV